ncbi:MAG: phosphate ABC transporter permease subunit PstC [Pyrobaculum sp.]
MLGLVLLFSALAYLVSIFILIALKFRWGMRLAGFVSLAIIGGMMAVFLYEAMPALERYGFSLLITAGWDPPREEYGLLPAIVGTLATSAVAIAIAMPLAISVAVVINEMLPRSLRNVFSSLVDLIAAMPTVIFGLWGLFVLGPMLADFLNNVAGDYVAAPLSLLTASILLAVMITPYAAAVIREGYALVPKVVEEAIYSIGATRLEAILIKLRYVKNYIFGGFFLALGRAMGETVAVAMVVGGNYSRLPQSLLESGITLSSLIALQFPNAFAYTYMVPVLFTAALMVALLGVVINGVAIYILYRTQI